MKTDFKIAISPSVIDDLNSRLAATRWIDEVDNDKWQYGTNEEYLKSLCSYWQNGFSWKEQEDYLNMFPHYKTDIDGIGLHFIYAKGEGSHTLPLLLTHGWPDCFIRFVKLIPLLTKAGADGFSFDVVIPSIPGFGFSDKPAEPGMNPKRIADLFAELMTKELGYDTFLAHGGDWGSTITEHLGLYHARHLQGIHLTDVPWNHLFSIPEKELSKAEQKYLKEGKTWSQTEGAYASIQSTKPQSLSYALNDSPAGLAGWIIEKFFYWSDNDGSVEDAFTKEELLANLTIYWATQTINSANRIYYEAAKEMMNARYNPLQKLNPFDKTDKKVEVPTAVAIFPKDIVPAPREFAERFFNVRRWTEMKEGGHFAAMERPQLLAEDIRAFAQEIKAD